MHQISTVIAILVTVLLALFVQSSVFTLSAFAVSFLAATVGVSVLLKIVIHNISVFSINLVLLISGFFAIVWRLLGLNNFVNEAFPSILLGIIVGVIAEKYYHKYKKQETT